jgi:hypothetical protein
VVHCDALLLRQTPLIAKQPPERLIPLAKVDDALEEVTLSAVVCRPPKKVEVAVLSTVRNPVVVAPPLIVSPPACVPLPMVDDAKAVRPLLNCVRVEVALPARPNGYAETLALVR